MFNTRRIIIATLASFLFVISSVFIAYSYLIQKQITPPEGGVILDIKQGDTLQHVLNQLIELDLISATWPIKIHARLNNLGGGIKIGEFRLTDPMTLPELLVFISQNNQIVYAVQFIEGSSYKDALAVLHKEEKIQNTLTIDDTSPLLELLGLSKEDYLEGRFYPDTYYYHKGDRDIDIMLRSHLRLKEILDQEWQNKQANLPLETSYEALILASIIEKETGVPEERAEISGVFIRRLKSGMRLQTDPTVIYGLGDEYQGNITRKHLKQDTPYNTYRISGLPPSPIALVGREAIHAALHPKEGKSLFFVAKGDGTHHFSETVEEHNLAVKEYQLNRRSDYRSSTSVKTNE